ncbi:phosphate ABC transporter permease PstA [Aeromonas salmonicida]|uniref:phosphate ABC transporter permease PstA n=1 Tax=Aeromonas salmonicida TaxID=645 RepID=UPI00073B9894|nr:phosphate ABC transporter permease PstA [Aeromonas salmonicida]KTA81754.1 phosphate ABC transporter permease [Aeromonas salmonicida]MDE7525948.1 phosphate ABC transporter permease PstA [Aeromonas salmonicida]MDE7530212.1 phosphate ABC transporter permease PstA [Aeromonas salmonicida]UUI59491.1 phosphate ABC transporter permease PstA [Aeromonas salmonicida]
MGKWFKSGAPWIWMTGGAVSLSLVAVLGLLLLIGWRGLIYFWPHPIYEWQIQDVSGNKSVLIGEINDSELVPVERLRAAGIPLEGEDREVLTRYLVKTGNREFVDLDFRWVLETDIKSQSLPAEMAVIERTTNGNFYGYVVQAKEDGVLHEQDLHKVLKRMLARSNGLSEQASKLQKGAIGSINYQLEKLRLKERKAELNDELTAQLKAELVEERKALNDRYQILEKELFSLRAQADRDAITVKDMRGELVTMPMSKVLDVTWPNAMGLPAKVGHWFHQIGKFVTGEPREANTEGGVFPAIFGTVFMVILMAIIVTPLGVVAAVYLHEYAGKNSLTKLIRIAVINLAGVPSIVYGVFGLGFFVYTLGGSLDQLFYPEALPSPTFGSPGVIWSALTLAILTLPVVIVSTEEGLSRIPSTIRQGSLALGATQAETLWRIVLPMASPAIMTGLILAIARAAGEVAPLMLVGVVKLAPTLPMDGNFPYLHVERKFMHLGFHIYDVGFQSPNVEAARPLVYATSFLLVTVIVGLNLTAIGIRNHLREKFRSLEH